jgi:alpha-L-fucosidase
MIMLSDIVSRGGNLLLDIGPATDGTIPVIMEERLTEMGKWLTINGEAIYGTSSWKHDKQWSTGTSPVMEAGNYQTFYDIALLVIPTKGQANVEMFFTRKNQELYCIVPTYVSTLSRLRQGVSEVSHSRKEGPSDR